MGYDLAVYGLIRKRAELASQVTKARADLVDLIAQLNHIDSAIRVFKPDIELEDLPEDMPAAPFAGFKGEIRRYILDTLRGANGPVSTFEIADGILERRQLDPKDKIAVTLIRRRTGYALSKLRKQGVVVSSRPHNSAVMLWRLAGSHSPPSFA